ncbi:ABC transporter substrate-binding protein [Cupriavidus basilensis OR16]|uniref:ABC transporter substrate-binding protein n=1 Tax=Cupriavidus basilensis OR16 TaxID=1127483 RepID=H1SIT0_9BURK|nr:ABC transporter substrate-binding protein [Cupriavidus basilensis OR16]
MTVTDINVPEYRDAVLRNVSFESQGYRKADWDKIQAVQ